MVPLMTDCNGDTKTDSFLGDMNYFVDQRWFRCPPMALLKFLRCFHPTFSPSPLHLSQLALQPDSSPGLTWLFTYFLYSCISPNKTLACLILSWPLLLRGPRLPHFLWKGWKAKYYISQTPSYVGFWLWLRFCHLVALVRYLQVEERQDPLFLCL